MKKILKSAFITCSIVFAMSALTSCDGEDPFATTGDEKGESTIPTVAGKYQVNDKITAEAGSIVDYAVTFKEADKKMYRLYVSQNIYGSKDGTVPYELKDYALGKVSTKSDGSVDLNNADKVTFSKTIPLIAPASTGGVTVYKIWVTGGNAFSTGKGDFRDTSKNNAYGAKDAYILVTITAGTANVTATAMKEYSATILNAPLRNGTSKSFVSVYDGQTYKIANQTKSITDTYTKAQQEENAQAGLLWDFGYYYTSGSAKFASASTYMENFASSKGAAYVDITRITGLAKVDLNNFYMEKVTVNFDSANPATLNGLTRPSSQKVTNLIIGDVIKFQDNSGLKGLIKVTGLVRGDGNNGKITFKIKVQDISVKL